MGTWALHWQLPSKSSCCVPIALCSSSENEHKAIWYIMFISRKKHRAFCYMLKKSLVRTAFWHSVEHIVLCSLLCACRKDGPDMPGMSQICRICRLGTSNPKRVGGGFRGPFCVPTDGVLKISFGDQYCKYGRWPTQEKTYPVHHMGHQPTTSSLWDYLRSNTASCTV